jgi:hypothetical protein
MKVLGCQKRHKTKAIARQQPGRELPSSGPTTRAQDAGIQVTGPGPAVRLNPLRDLQHLQYRASSVRPTGAAYDGRWPWCCWSGSDQSSVLDAAIATSCHTSNNYPIRALAALRNTTPPMPVSASTTVSTSL